MAIELYDIKDYANNINDEGKKIQKKNFFRILILDEDRKSVLEIENSISEVIKTTVDFSGAEYYHISRPDQLLESPNSAAFNMLWLHMGFPNAVSLACEYYKMNPFCYIVCYGSDVFKMRHFLHSRPIAYISNLQNIKSIQDEMSFVREMDYTTLLRLTTRGAYYDIPLQSLVYCRSEGRKTLFYMDSPQPIWHDPSSLVNESALGDVFFSYQQNIKLNDVERKLNKSGFLRVHQSYLINQRFVKELNMKKEGWSFLLQGKSGQRVDIPVSENHREEAKSFL